MRARSYHTSPGRCKASVLCTSLWMIQANTLFSGCPVVDERGCGKVDKGRVAGRASVGKFALSTSGRRIHSAACEFRYLQRRVPADLLLFRRSGCPVQGWMRESTWLFTVALGR